jgi:long-chain acyl-CoA synthetase
VALMSEDLTRIDDLETIPGLFWNRVTTHADSIALREKDFGIWNEITWAQYGEQARLIGLGLKALGMGRGDVCSIASEINKEWLFADLGIICAGGVCNGVYPTDASNQVEYLINDSGTRFYFAEDEEQLDKVLEVRDQTPTLQKIIIFDMEGLRSFDDEQCMSLAQLVEIGRDYLARHPNVWAEEIAAARPDDVMILTYTSGTTGMPKGAMISQRNMMVMLNYVQQGLGAHAGDEQLGFLPLAHIAGRLFYTFSPLQSLATVNLVESLETTVQDIQEVSPTLHFAVPRVWEKQYSTVAIKLKEATALGRIAYEWAISVGYRAAKYRIQNTPVPPALAVLNSISDFLVLRNVRKALGIDSARRLFTGAAPIAPDLINWYWALNRPMFELFGQTEATGIVTTNTPEQCRIGSVGKPIADVQIRLSDKGEILIKGGCIIDGYWNKPEKTAETIIDGWLHTGDVGRIDDDGFVYLVDRMKDIIITAGGKNITPSEIENQLKFSPFIADAVVIGDKRPYLTCLIMIDQENVTKFAQDEDVVFTNYTSLCHTREVNDLVGREIEKVNQKFARVESIKKYRLIDQLLDAEDEELTPTMKLKRKVVNVKYADLIDSMYKN